MRLDGVVDGGGDALDGGGDAEDVPGADGAVGVAVAVEGVAFERRQGGRDGGGQREVVEGRGGGQVEEVFADPPSGGDGTGGVADRLAVAEDGASGRGRGGRFCGTAECVRGR